MQILLLLTWKDVFILFHSASSIVQMVASAFHYYGRLLILACRDYLALLVIKAEFILLKVRVRVYNSQVINAI